MREVTLKVVGTVRSRRDSAEDRDWGALVSTIEMLPEYAGGLDGIEQFSHAIVLFYMHLLSDAEPPAIHRRPRVFAQRARMRPNHVGITSCAIVGVQAGGLVVRGLDALDGTPVLDIKPYVPVFDRRDATVPEWMDRLMEGYF